VRELGFFFLKYEYQSARVDVLRKMLKACRLAITTLVLWSVIEEGCLAWQ
jgi:hypothetical protein